jgi:tetratricopeptide (TPR) repeat protein
VTESVVGAIAPAVEKAEIERAKRKPTASLDAYALYLRGLARLYQFGNRQANDEALRLFNSAIELDPEFASAYGRAAFCYVIAKINGWISDTANAIAEVKRLAQRAVELGKDDAIALAASGWALAFVVRDLGVGAGLIDRALVLNSNLAEAWNFGGWVKIWLGEPETAIERFARAMRLSPLDPWLLEMRAGTAYAHFFLGRHDEAAIMGGNGIAGQSGLSTWITYHRSKQRHGRAAGASTQGSGSAARTESRATSFHSQRRAEPLSTC